MIRQVVVNEVKPEVVFKQNFTNKSGQSCYPVAVEDDKIRIYGEMIRVGVYLPFEYKGKNFLIRRPKEGTLELYQFLD